MELGLRQKDLAEQLGVNKDTIRNWEVGRASPALWQWPQIIQFLHYVPFSADEDLPDLLKVYRRLHGVSQRELARLLAVDESTVWHWERGAAMGEQSRSSGLPDPGPL